MNILTQDHEEQICYEPSQSSKYKSIQDEVTSIQEELSKMLSDYGESLLDNLVGKMYALSSMACRHYYETGFKDGVKWLSK